MNIRNYVNHIQNSGFYGGEIEISIAVDLYNINIVTYNEIRDDNNNIMGYTYIRYYDSNDGQENRHLMILTNRNHNHFNLIYYNQKQIDYNFNIEDINNNENNYINRDLQMNSKIKKIDEISTQYNELEKENLEDIPKVLTEFKLFKEKNLKIFLNFIKIVKMKHAMMIFIIIYIINN